MSNLTTPLNLTDPEKSYLVYLYSGNSVSDAEKVYNAFTAYKRFTFGADKLPFVDKLDSKRRSFYMKIRGIKLDMYIDEEGFRVYTVTAEVKFFDYLL